MIVVRAMFGSRRAFEEIRDRSLWIPFFLLAIAPIVVTLGAVLFLGVRLPDSGDSRLPQSLLLLGIGVGIPLVWAARCGGTALLLAWSGTLLGAPSRLGPMAVAAAAASAPLSLKGLIQSMMTLGYLLGGRGPSPLLDDSIGLVLGEAAPEGIAGAVISSFGLFEMWSAVLLALAVAVITGRGLRQAWLQSLPVWLVTVSVTAGGELFMNRAG